jgi:putative acetyltransferase
MEFTMTYGDRTGEIAALFRATFTESEGAAEGDLIGTLVDRMFATVKPTDILAFLALDDGVLAGTAIFTRMDYPQDDRTVFILSPMAVATSRQGTGVGQALLSFALEQLRQSGVDVALTYGDINFYSKVGFTQIPQTTAQPPLPLQYPEGWLGQSLTDRPLDPLQGPSSCVGALNDPALW